MRNSRSAVLLLAIALLVGMVFASSATADRPANPKLVPVQLALGDSWAAGVGATIPTKDGYVPQLYQKLLQDYDCPSSGFQEGDDGCPLLELENLAVGGATTDTMVANQFPEAISLLKSHNGDGNRFNDAEPTTVHIGGNDVTGPILTACLGGLTPTCVATIQFELSDLQSDLNAAMSQLRDAAGDGIIVLGTYDNPIEDPSCRFFPIPGAVQLGALVLEGSALGPGVNDIIRSVAASHGAYVADVFNDFDDQNDWAGDCLHPDDSGYDKVTEAFVEVLRPLLGLD
jgi:lysophospholipase L1-like esterase